MISEKGVISKRLAAIATAIIVAVTSMVGVLAVNTSSASAASCPDLGMSWKTATWGRGCARRTSDGPGYFFYGASDDIKEDGHCVIARKQKSDGSWQNLAGSQSCGAINSWDTAGGGSEGGVQAIRLVNGSGNYMTLWD